MRVLHVLAESGYSGGEQQLEFLLRHLVAKGHPNGLVLVAGAKFGAVGRELGLPTFRSELRRPWSVAPLLAVRRAVREFEPDVVHFGCGRSLLWGGLACLGLEIPLRVTTRRIDYPIGRAPWRAGRYRWLVDHVVANCESVRRRVLDAGVPDDRVTLVHEGIDVEPWIGLERHRSAARTRLGIADDAIVVTCAATLRPRKGQRVLIEAFAALAPDHPTAVLWLAGGGRDLEVLRDEVGRRGLGGRIVVPGPVDPVAELYAASDLFVMPSFHEGLSNACLEASAAGLPMVVSEVGGLPEIVESGVTGDVVPPGDPQALQRSLNRYLLDADLRRNSGAAGRARTCERFTAQRMAEGMEALFERLLASGGSTSP